MKAVKHVLTVSCKIEATPEQIVQIDETLQAFADACEYINKTLEPHLTNEIAMQSLIYQDVRARFGLSSQMAIHAIRRVSSNRKTAKQKGFTVEKFSPTSATYDQRTFSLRESDWSVSLTMVGKRQRFALMIGNYQKHLLKGLATKTATLVKRNDGSYYCNIQYEANPEDPQPTKKVIGVDLGRTDIAFTSEGDSFSGAEVTATRDKYSRVRASIQRKASKGTRSTRRRARRLLQRLSGKEKRFQSWVNHTVSDRIIQRAKLFNQAIALEDLTGIRERTNQLPRSKTERRRSNSWSFFQLRQYLTYKSVKFSVKLVLVDPRYTSQTCHKCLHIHPIQGKSYRTGKKFECGHCGWIGDADLNGAKNIANNGAVVNLPGGSELACSLEEHVLGLLKAPSAYAVG
jgi:putative transposase